MPDNDNSGESVKRSLRERKFIDAYIENNGNATEAYLAISPKVTRESARELGKRMIAKVDLSIIEILNNIGLTDPVLGQKLKDGLEATRESGKGVNKKEVLDHSVIVKYLDMVLKLKSKYPADKGKYELTGKDGQPLGGTFITLVTKSYQDCPLKHVGQCPARDKVRELDPKGYQDIDDLRKLHLPEYKEIDNLREDQINVKE